MTEPARSKSRGRTLDGLTKKSILKQVCKFDNSLGLLVKPFLCGPPFCVSGFDTIYKDAPRWRFEKDGSTSKGRDEGFIDNLQQHNVTEITSKWPGTQPWTNENWVWATLNCDSPEPCARSAKVQDGKNCPATNTKCSSFLQTVSKILFSSTSSPKKN